MRGSVAKGDRVDLVFDTSVDDNRVEDTVVIDPNPDDGVLFLGTVRVGGPRYRVHDDGRVALDSPKSGIVLSEFGEDAKVVKTNDS